MDTSERRCGYTWPDESMEGGADASSVSTPTACCYREVWGDRDRCIFHTPDQAGVVKPDAEMERVRETPENRKLNRNTGRNVAFTPDERPPSEILYGAYLPDAPGDRDLGGVDLRHARCRRADLSNAHLSGADLSDADLYCADLAGATLHFADLTDANLSGADLQDADLVGAGLVGASLDGADLTSAVLGGADLADAELTGANLSRAGLWRADIVGADLWKADLTDANLSDADLTDANLERALFSRADLFGATLRGAHLEGAVFGDVQIDEAFFANLSPEGGADSSAPGARLGRLLGGPTGEDAFRCSYDAKSGYEVPDRRDDPSGRQRREVRAAGVYRQFERLAANNAFPEWQSRFFILRQDMQTRRLRREGRAVEYLGALVVRSLFGYGERFLRVVGWSVAFVLVFALAYLASGGLQTPPVAGATATPLRLADVPGDPGGRWDVVYYSALTFTAGDTAGIEPSGYWGEVLRTVEVGTGAILVALLVFVLGRRAAR